MTSTTKKSAPISRHPAFPVVVALWFAALFGLGSLALQVSLLESLVQAIRLDQVIPAAAPPLGFTARLLLAVLLAVTGGLTGFVLARGFAARGTATPRRSARQEDDRGGVASPASARAAVAVATPDRAASDDNDDLARLEAARESNPPRRRGLNTQLVVDPFATAPLPTMTEPGILNLGDLTAIEPISSLPPAAAVDDAARQAADPAGPLAAEAPLDEPVGLVHADTTASVAPVPAGQDAPFAGPTGPDLVAAPSNPPAPAVDAAPAIAEPAPPPAPALKLRQGSAAELLRQAPLDSLGVVELVERFALALAARREREALAAATAVAAPTPAPDPTVQAPEVEAPHLIVQSHGQNGQARPFDMPAMPRPAIPNGSIEWLSTAERAAGAQPALPPEAPVQDKLPRAAEFDEAAEPDADDQDPGHLRGLEDGGWALPDLDDEPEDTLGIDPGQLPVTDASDLTAEPGDPGFSSLLAMKPAARPSAPPPFAAPSLLGAEGETGARTGSDGPAPEATEEALRKALATLQRMSGAA